MNDPTYDQNLGLNLDAVIKQYLKQHLSIEVNRRSPYSNDFTIKLYAEGEEITRDSFSVESMIYDRDNL